MSGLEADSKQSVVTERLKRLFRHKSKISRRRANVLRSSNQPPPSLIGTGVNRDSSLNVSESRNNFMEPEVKRKSGIGRRAALRISEERPLRPGLNGLATQRAKLRLQSDLMQGTMQRSKTKQKVKVGTSDI